MKTNVDISSLSISKSNSLMDSFEKYEIQANIDEIENVESNSTFKYTFTILSQPKNIRISVDGIIQIFGKIEEREIILEKNEDDIPKILPMVYQELFPLFFTLSKSVNIPCPPYQILALGTESDLEEMPVDSTDIDESEKNTDDTIQKEDRASDIEPDMPLDKLQEQYTSLTEEYKEQPSEDLQKKINTISELINNKTSKNESIETKM